MAVESQFKKEMEAFWTVILDLVSAASVWNALKAYSCGQYQTVIARLRRERRAELTRLEAEASRQEVLYIRTQDSQQFSHLQSLTKGVLLLRTSLKKKNILHQSQHIFEHEENMGRLLAWLSREQTGGSVSLIFLVPTEPSSLPLRR